MRLILAVLFSIFGFSLLLGQESKDHFGTISMQKDAQEEQTFWITNALLYENASIDFDTTVQVQDEKEIVIYYYPQILEGTDNVLRLILEPQDKADGNFYDVTFNLGDSLEEKIAFQGDSAKVYFNQNGQLNDFQQVTKNINGIFLISTEKHENQIISGELDISFDLPQTGQATELSQISMTGNFEVPTGEFREVSLSSSAPTKDKNSKYKQNIYFAIIITAIAIIALGIQ